jgi:tetratricopeptide (TPR) repeat protein
LRVKKPEVLRETGDRLEKQAYALVVENGYENHDRFPLLDDAWPTVAAALPLFIAGENEQLHVVCEAFWRFLEFTGRWDEWLALSRDAESRAVAVGDFDNAGWRAYQAAWVHYLRGQSAELVACAERAEAHWREAGAGDREHAIAIRLRGIGHELAGDLLGAIADYRESVEVKQTLGRETEDVLIGLNDLADTERMSGDLDAAERDYREALRIAHTVNDREGIALVTGNLGLLALDRKDWPNAEALAREALPLSEKVGRQELIASNCLRLAEALMRQGKKEEALPYARGAIEIFQKLGSPYLAAAQQTLAECES